jgi:TrmH family RNA methyltransferase
VRDEEGFFVAEGTRVLQAALAAELPLEALYLDLGASLNGATEEVVESARARGIRIFGLAPGVIDRVTDTVTPQPLLGVVPIIERRLADLAVGHLLVLVDVRDPGNIGTIIRSADAAGLAGVVTTHGCGDLFNPKVVRASAGSLFHLPLVREGDAGDLVRSLGRSGYLTVATTLDGAVDYADLPLERPLAILLGNEANGLTERIIASCAARATIPIAGGAESLNVAMAATVIAFDLARRRRQASHEVA